MSSEDHSELFDRPALEARLSELRIEHRDMDDAIEHLAEKAPFDRLKLQRMKKRKLVLKDQILRLEDMLIPDIIA